MKRSFFFLIIFFSLLYSCTTIQEEDLNSKHLDLIAESINQDLASIRRDIITLANVLQYKISFNKEINSFPDQKYHYSPDQILFTTHNKTLSAVYFPANKNLTDQLKKTIVNTELLDSFFINTIKKNPLLAQVYFIDTNSFLRIYPYIDVVNYLKCSIDLTNLIPYQTAEHKPFIDDKGYWLDDPYADPYGRGWIISCLEPIYYREKFIGILSGDIALHTIKNKYCSSLTESLLIIDHNGKIICCTKEAARIINIPVLREFRYYKPVTETILHSNLSLTDHANKSFREAIISLLSGKKENSFYLENKKFTIYKAKINETGWVLLKIIN